MTSANDSRSERIAVHMSCRVCRHYIPASSRDPYTAVARYGCLASLQATSRSGLGTHPFRPPRHPTMTPTTGGRAPMGARHLRAARGQVPRGWGRGWLRRRRIGSDLPVRTRMITTGEISQHRPQFFAAQQQSARWPFPCSSQNRTASRQADVGDCNVVIAPANGLYGAKDVHFIEGTRLAFRAGDLGLDSCYRQIPCDDNRHAPSPLVSSKGRRYETVARPRAQAPSKALYRAGSRAFQGPQDIVPVVGAAHLLPAAQHLSQPFLEFGHHRRINTVTSLEYPRKLTRRSVPISRNLWRSSSTVSAGGG